MLKMSTQIEHIVNAYKTVAKIPAIFGGKVSNCGKSVTSKWSVRNLDKGRATKYAYNYRLDDGLRVVSESEFGNDISNELLSSVSPRETFRAVIREEKDGKDKKQYLEVWTKNTLAHSVNLTALEIHGDVYADSEFSTLDWSQDESSIVYIAEKKMKKSEPFIKRKGSESPTPDHGSGEAPHKKGEEYIYRADWGEQLVGKHLSVIVVCDIQTETFTVLEGLPDSWCPGQVRFLPSGRSVVGVAWETEPTRLGLMFCTNRPSYIFELSLDGNMKTISNQGMAVRSPRVTPSGEVVWLQRTANGPHHACHALCLNDTKETKTVIDIVQTECTTSDGDPFYGLYSTGLPERCFASEHRIIFSTPQQTATHCYVADLADGGRLVDISNKSFDCSTTILDVHNDVVLATCTNMNTPHQLWIARLPPPSLESGIEWVRVSEPREVPSLIANATFQRLHLTHDTNDPVSSFTAMYLAPAVELNGKLPLVVWPHGGPHVSFVNSYSMDAAFFSMLGFASLQINYRGSTGTGQASVDYLTKHVGDADVKDCKYATDVAIQQFDVDENQLVLFGGSHGGFLVTHLSGQYPDFYKVVVTRNPVTDLASMFNSTDIMDWGQQTRISWLYSEGRMEGSLLRISAGNTRISIKLWLHETRLRISLACSILLMLWIGLASIRINFRGSTGLGDANVRSLIGHVGDYDVSDCLLALTTALERDSRLDADWLLYGGSYGGCVAAHLAGMFPDKFSAAVMRNPLVDLATKGCYADNCDGCAVEAGFPYSETGPVTEDELLAMRRCSPIVHAHKVKAPTCLMLGSGDLRVPKFQGLHYARMLKVNGVPVRVQMFEDNHSLSSLAHEMDHMINAALWFLEHLQKS